MILELLEELSLTKGLREALPFFVGFVEEFPDTSATKIIEMARTTGLTFRDSGAFNLIGQLKDTVRDIRACRQRPEGRRGIAAPAEPDA